MHREIVCEVCGRRFGYDFEVAVDSVVSRGRRTTDAAAITPRLEHELRRPIRCPHCQALQRTVRRLFVWREIRHSAVGLVALGGTAVGAVTLTSGGYLLAGFVGLTVGLGLSIVLVLRLTRWMLGELIDSVPRDRKRDTSI